MQFRTRFNTADSSAYVAEAYCRRSGCLLLDGRPLAAAGHLQMPQGVGVA